MDLFEKYYTLAIRYLSRRPYSEKELRNYLTKKKVEPVVIEKIISLLKEHKFLDDVVFAKFFIESRKAFRKKSDRFIKMELRQKGISDEVLEKAQETIEQKKSDNDVAQELVERKFVKYKDLPRQEIYQKLGALLARRGFDWDTIKAAIDYKMKEGV